MNIFGSYANISSILGVFGKQKIHGRVYVERKMRVPSPLPSLSPPIGLGAQIDEGLLFVRGQMNEFSTNRGGGGWGWGWWDGTQRDYRQNGTKIIQI